MARNIDRVRRRRQRATASPLSQAQRHITLGDGTALQVPSKDEMVPEARKGPLSLNPLLDFVEV